ncbi:protein transport protein Sec16B isoform X2 [Arvicanthis niloticus]|uniref:protein transport protein Sec16B isoform X2 n=1 Tax=Arvicanthis niloticus TaxID=61156 RepID=UPI00402B36D2
MEPWVPQTQGRTTGPSRDANRVLQSGHYRPRPHPQYHQWQDVHKNSKPQQDPRDGHQQLHYVPRSGEWSQPVSGADYLKGSYPSHLYSRSGYEDPYQRYHTPTPRDEYGYGNYYYHGHPQLLPEEREGAVARQGSPYIWHEDHGDQRYFNEHHGEKHCSTFGANSDTQFQFTSKNPYRDSPASMSGQEQPGEFFPESEAQKQKPSLTSKSNLLQQHESGLSSSSYELSQYMAAAPEQYELSAAWRPIQADDTLAAAPKAPMRFYVPHVSVSFGPGGQLVCVSPNSPADGQTALVEVHSMEVILNDFEDQEEMRCFPGPLIREDIHKVDIMTFCQRKAAQCLKSETPGSRDSALLWQLLVLLCRQNGSMAGSDIAELLMQDCKKLEKYKRQPPVANLINLTDEDWPVQSSGTRNLLTGEIPPNMDTPAQIVEKFTKLLYYGRKKEALEWAMKNHLWGHALFLASKMDPRTYSWVMSGFTSTLALNDPLQTLFQLMSGRIPQAATCCGDKQWGDWRPHLAVILSNQAGDTELYQRAIVSMGDTLAGKGFVEASHFCYLMAHVPFGHYTVKTDHLALVGSSHSQEFWKFATIEAIQRTEIFEYCQMLGRPKSFIPSFQVYKLLYASRLADYGLASQALHYCEAIGAAVLSQGGSSHPVLLAELIKLAEKLKLSDPLVLERRRGDRDLEPNWLVQLRRKHKELEQNRTGDLRDPGSTSSDIYGARGTTDAPYRNLSSHQNYSDDSEYNSALWPTPEQTSLANPTPHQPFPLQQDPYSDRDGSVHTGTPVPLYSVPATHFSVASGASGGDSSVAVMGAPGGRAGEETLKTHPALGENTVPQEPLQDPDGLEVISSPQTPPAPRARSFSEESVISAKEDEEGSSDGADKPSHPDVSQKEKLRDGKNAKSSGFGWFSWFRSKPANSVSTSGDEDSADSSDSEESPRTSPPHHTSPGLSPTPPLTSSSLPGGSSLQGSSNNSGIAEGVGIGGFSGTQGVSSEFYSQPGALPPPPTLQGAVPLYNPSQVPQLPTASSLNRPNRLAQRRYPTQPC